MSQDTYQDDHANHDNLKYDVYIDDLIISSLNFDNLAGDDDGDGSKWDVKLLQVQITELDVKFLTSKHILLQTHSAQHAQSSGCTIAERETTLRNHVSEQRSQRCRISKQ